MHDQPCHYPNAEIIWVSDVSSASRNYSPCHRARSSDGCCGESVKFSPCMKITVVMGEIWPGKWGLWLMVVQISFLKCDMLSQIQDRYSKVLLSLLMTSSFKVSKLYSLSSRFTEQKARLCCVGGGDWVFFFFFISIFAGSTQEIIIDHSLLLLECYWVGGLKKFTIQSCSLFLCSTSRKDVSLSNEGQENDHFGTKNVLMRTIKLGIWTHIWQLLCKLPFFAVPLDWIQAGLPVIGSTFWAVCFLEQVVQSITGSSEF